MHDPEDQMKKWQQAGRHAASAFCAACHAGDVNALCRSMDLIFETTVDGWTRAIRKVAREQPAITDEIKAAFQGYWIEAGNFPLKVCDDKALATALRLLLPPYEGPPVRLYRGTTSPSGESGGLDFHGLLTWKSRTGLPGVRAARSRAGA